MLVIKYNLCWDNVKMRSSPPLLMSSSCGSGEGLSLEGDGDVFTPAPGFVGALN